jgi:hypothetical protein
VYDSILVKPAAAHRRDRPEKRKKIIVFPFRQRAGRRSLAQLATPPFRPNRRVAGGLSRANFFYLAGAAAS